MNDFYIDDPCGLTVPLTAEDRAKVVARFATVFPITRRGEYLNRFGERVTWESSGDGRYAALHTEWRPE